MPLSPTKLAADFLRVDGLEPVRYQRLNEAGTPTLEVLVPKALARATSERLVVGDRIIAPSGMLVWHVPAAALGSLEPRQGDLILTVDRPGAWVVHVHELQTLRTRWRFTCVAQ